MQERLLMAVRDKAGIPIRNRGDCEVLSDLILEVTDEFVSYNTLRRLYGMASAVKPRRQTLDVLAAFCGFLDYQEFCLSSSVVARWKASEKMFSLLDSGSVPDILEAIESASDHAERMDLLIQLSRELLLTEQQEKFAGLFDSSSFQVLGWEYSHQLHFGTAVGLLFRKIQLREVELLGNLNFLECVYSTFVDYTNLNGFYGEWTDLVRKKSRAPDVDVFAKCIHGFRAFLNQEALPSFDWPDALIQGLHPILRSRVFAVNCMAGECDFDGLWERIHGSATKQSPVSIIWIHEISFFALISGNRDLIKWIIEDLSFEDKNLVYFEYHHRHVFLLVQLAHLVLNGRHLEAREVVGQFDLMQIRIGYREFVELIWLRLTSELDMPMDRGAMETLRVGLNYPRLSKSWLGGYCD
ncbi:hypothetical protein OAO65_02090 [Flavobacteriales bacterium]|nr:hypothetical protein [Flavobacteriales bacterium]